MSEKKFKVVNGETYEYVLYKRVDPYSDILKQKLETFDFANPPINPRELALSLIETMVYYHGLGLSANQVGLPYRVFVMGAESVGFACFNPEIISAEGEEDYSEGCISYPGLFLKVKRAKSIKVRYTDMNGVQKEQQFDGLTARIFQHELDHLNGVDFTSKVSKTVLSRAKDKVKKNLKNIERAQKEALIMQSLKNIQNKTQQIQEKTKNISDLRQMIEVKDAAPVQRELPKTFDYTTP